MTICICGSEKGAFPEGPHQTNARSTLGFARCAKETLSGSVTRNRYKARPGGIGCEIAQRCNDESPSHPPGAGTLVWQSGITRFQSQEIKTSETSTKVASGTPPAKIFGN